MNDKELVWKKLSEPPRPVLGTVYGNEFTTMLSARELIRQHNSDMSEEELDKFMASIFHAL